MVDTRARSHFWNGVKQEWINAYGFGVTSSRSRIWEIVFFVDFFFVRTLCRRRSLSLAFYACVSQFEYNIGSHTEWWTCECDALNYDDDDGYSRVKSAFRHRHGTWECIWTTFGKRENHTRFSSWVAELKNQHSNGFVVEFIQNRRYIHMRVRCSSTNIRLYSHLLLGWCGRCGLRRRCRRQRSWHHQHHRYENIK